MSAKSSRGIWLLILALVALVACGGAGPGGAQSAGGGIGGSGISYGAIAKFGSIFVNGVEFGTNDAAVTLNGIAGPDAGTDPHRGLKQGMVVRVNGDFDDRTGTALEVEYEDNVEGPIDAIATVDAHTKQLVVLGQTVIIDDTGTHYENTTFATIMGGDFVEVSGLQDQAGRIHATYVENKAMVPAEVEVKGFVQNVDATSKTFMLNDLTVDYSSAALADFPGSDPANGQFVEVKGIVDSLGQLVAASVELKLPGVAADDAAKVEVEGFVTVFTSPSDFTVGSQPVVTTAATRFVGGLQGEIALGSRLEVEGSLANGVLTATKVEFEESVKIESNATVSGSTITLEGLPGVTVTANMFTEFDGGTAANPNNLAPLNGRNVRIRGRASGPTSVVATEIEDRGMAVFDADVILQGQATSVSNPAFEILGAVVDTAALGPGGFKDADDQPIGGTAFFNALSGGDKLVKAKGRLPTSSGDVMDAITLKEVELED